MARTSSYWCSSATSRSTRADLVLLWHIPGNDVWNNLFPTHWPKDGWPKPTYWIEDGELQGPSEPWLGDADPPVKLLLLAKRALGWSRDASWEPRLPEPYAGLAEYDGDGEVDLEWEDPKYADENLATEKSHWSIQLSPRSPRMRYALDLSRLLLEEIRQLTASRGIDFLIFRTAFDFEREGFQHPRERIRRRDGLYYVDSTAQQHANLRYLAEGFDYLLLPLRTEDWRVSEDDAHFNARAVDDTMKQLAEVVHERLGESGSAPRRAAAR